MADRVGQQLGNYRLLSRLGKGGFGQVYLGEHVYLKTHAAIKLLLEDMDDSSGEDFHAAFLKEARRIAALKHPHILRVLEFGIETSTPYLVMEYAAHGTLLERHPRSTKVPLDQAVRYSRQIGLALDYAHETGLIHRDLKPANVLLDEQDTILLSDFGIATIAHHTSSMQTTLYAGTPAYMAPEQLQGKPVPASDQYSLAIMVYEWLCGQLPYQGDPFSVGMQHLTAPPPPLCVYNSAVSSNVEAMVQKAMAKDPKQRFVNVQAFAAALEQAFQSDQSTFVRPIVSPSLTPSLPPTQYASTSPISVAANPNSPRIEKLLKTGDVFLQRKDYEEAIAAYEEVIKLAPNEMRAYRGKSEVLLLLKRYREVVDLFEQGKLLFLEDNDMHKNKGHALCKLESYEEALALYKQVLRLDFDDADAYTGKGDALTGLKRYAEALVAYEQALQLAPDHIEACIGKGSALRNLKRSTEALAYYEHIEQRISGDARVYAGKARVFWDLECYDDALIAYDKALLIDPGSASILSNKVYLLTYPLGRNEDGLDLCNKLIQIDPSNGDHYILLGGILNRLGRREEALATYELAIQTDPSNGDHYMPLGELLNRLGRNEEALAAYERAIPAYKRTIQAEPNNAWHYIHLGELLNRLGRREEALATYELAIQTDPNNHSAYFYKGLRQDYYHPEEALIAFNEAARLDPKNALYQNCRGDHLTRLKRYSEALAAYEKATELAAGDTTSYEYRSAQRGKIELGDVLQGLGRDEEALAAYERAIQAEPSNFEYYRKLAELLSKLSRSKEAFATYERAIRANPNDASPYYYKTYFLGAEEALIALNEAARLAPKYAFYQMCIGNRLQALKRYSEALAAYEKAIELDSGDPTSYAYKEAQEGKQEVLQLMK